MKRSDIQEKIRKSRLPHSCLALLLALSAAAALILPGYTALPSAGSADEDAMPLEESEGNDGLLASFDFGGSRLEDLSGNGVTATLVDDEHIIGTEDGNSYLDLTASDAYLELPGSTLNGLTEMTVEMRVKIKDNTNANWAFFAAPNGDNPEAAPTYLGVLIKDSQIKVERFAGSRGDLTDGNKYDDFYVEQPEDDDWYTIRVAFAEGSTTLYINDAEPVSQDNGYSLEQCLGIDGVLWFGHSSWGESFNGCIDDIRIWNTADPDLLTDSNLVASLDFEGENILADKSGNDRNGAFVGKTADNSDLFKTENSDNTYLDLTNRRIYLSLTDRDGKGVLNGLTEMTLELQVKTKDTGANWAFFAAPDNSSPTPDFEHYLGVLLNDRVTVERYANSGARATGPYIAKRTNDGEWHTVKAVFKENSTVLYVDNNAVSIGSNYSLAECLGEDGVLWFGHSPWTTVDPDGEYFNGCINYIKIWDHAIYDPIDEDAFTVKDGVSDPKNTTVNLFDYWIVDQYANDYEALDWRDRNQLLQGINDGHLLLFAGEQAFGGGSKRQATADQIGFWNRSTGEVMDNGILATTNEITQGIVQNTLVNGYPALALDDLAAEKGYTPSDLMLGGLKTLWESDNKKTESLAYLFDPAFTVGNGKASYTNVTGLFQLNDEGYYEFHSWDTFAELNIDQESGGKTSTGNNHITLYSEPWGWGLPNEHDGQFFPFNDWSDMFFIDQSGAAEQAYKNYDTGQVNDEGNPIYADGGVGQTYTDEPLNHYFGMTVETRFRQPVDGRLDVGGAEPMRFDFSGDDDVWIFIDDVLVGDLGGIHGWKAISIDFSTGNIYMDFNPKEQQDNSFDGIDPAAKLADMFEAAERGSTDGWKVTDQNDKIFPDNSTHTLKFFYLERGNKFSNCNITFNLQTVPEKTETTPGSGETVKPGDTIDYEISWGNYTNSSAELIFTDTLDDNVELVSAGCGGVTLEARKDGDGNVTYVPNGANGNVTVEYNEVSRTVTWTVKDVPIETDVKVFLTVEVKEDIEDGDIILNQATVTNSNICDLNNELIEYKTEIIKNPVADLDISKKQSLNGGEATTSTLTVKEGDTVTYLLTVEVKGTTDDVLEANGLEELKPVVLEDIVVEDTIPAELVPYSVTNGGTCEAVNNGTLIRWELGAVPTGTTVTLSYTVTIPHVDESATWKNIAYAVSDYTENGQPEYPTDPDDPSPWEPSEEVEIEDPVGDLVISKKVESNVTNGTIDTAKTFTFTVNLADPANSEAALSGEYEYSYVDSSKAGGKIASGGTVTLSHNETLIFKGLPAGTYYTVTEAPADGYTGTVQTGSASGRIEKDSTASAAFVNTYSADGRLELTLSKTVSGRDWKLGEEFTFELEPVGSHTVSAIDHGIDMPVSLDGRYLATVDDPDIPDAVFGISFTALSGDEPYVFRVSEVKPTDQGDLYYDGNKYTVYVEVTDEGDGNLLAAASYTVNEITTNSTKDEETDGNYSIAIPFTNQAHISTTIPVTKEIAKRDWAEGDSFEFTITSVTATPDYEIADPVAYPAAPITIAYEDTSKTKDFAGIEFYSTGTYVFEITETPSTDDTSDLIYDGAHTVTVVVGTNETSGRMEIKSATVDNNAYSILGNGKSVVFTNTLKDDDYDAGVTISVPIEKKLEGWKDEVFEFTIELIADNSGTMSGFSAAPVTLDKDSSTGSFELEFKSNGLEECFYVFEISETENSEYVGMIYADPYTLTVKVTDDMQGSMTAECYVDNDTNPIDFDTSSLIFVNKYSSDPPSGGNGPTNTPSDDEPTEPEETEASETEPPVTEPEPPEIYPPAEDDDLFNLDDDGLPEGDRNIYDNFPAGDKNLQTGVFLSGSLCVAGGALLVSALALAAGKRRYGRKDK